MAISFDSVGTGIDQNSGTISWTHSIVSNSNGILIASIGNSGTANVTSLTFAGSTLTKIIAGTSQTVQELELWYLLNPPVGLGTFNGTFSGTANNRTGVSMAYLGIKQTAPILGSVFQLGTTMSSGSVTTTLTNSDWFVGGIFLNSGIGTTSTGNERGTVTLTQEGMGADNTQGTLRWTFGFRNFVALGAELQAETNAGPWNTGMPIGILNTITYRGTPAGTAGVTPTKTLLGVGI